jgi:hypothetical protein
VLFHERQILVARPVFATDGDDACIYRQVAVQVRHVKGWQQFARGQISTASEDDHVKRKVWRS